MPWLFEERVHSVGLRRNVPGSQRDLRRYQGTKAHPESTDAAMKLSSARMRCRQSSLDPGHQTHYATMHGARAFGFGS